MPDDASDGAHAIVTRKSAGLKRDCVPCRGAGTIANADDPTTPAQCGTCHGRGYAWGRTDEKPDGGRKARMG
jgi:DnaJ-class molecular chaperone